MLKTAIIFTSGLVIGAAGSYFYLSKKMDEQYRQDSLDFRKEVEAMEQEIRQKEKLACVEVLTTESYADDAFIPTDDPFPYEEDTDNGEPIEDDFETIIEDCPKEAPDPNPYVITEEEYSCTKRYFGKGELYFFAHDGLITDDDEELIFDYQKFIGESAIPELESTHDTVYVRNEVLGEDYMITYFDRMWNDGSRY